VGKSSLLTRLTGTRSEVAAYEFTTLTCIPGTIHYRGARIQLLDMPGIIEGAKDGKGRGKQVISTARTCDVILIVLDASKPMTHKRIIERELEGFGIRLNKSPPNIVLTRKDKGGVMYRSSLPQPHLGEDLVKSICAEYKIHSCEIQVRQPNATADDLIDVIEGNRKYIPCVARAAVAAAAAAAAAGARTPDATPARPLVRPPPARRRPPARLPPLRAQVPVRPQQDRLDHH
jgi:hypothetical protein